MTRFPHPILPGALVFLLLPSLLFAQAAPTGLTAELFPGGEVSLTWQAPAADLNETFDGDSAEGFDYDPVDGVWMVEGGYLQGSPSTGWKSAWYADAEFGDAVVEAEFFNIAGQNSRGLLLRGNGARDDDYTGYCFYIAYNASNFSLYRYENGNSSIAIGWTPSAAINIEPGETNVLSAAMEGTQLVLFINGVEVASVNDGTALSGHVGVVSASGNEVWVDEIGCDTDPAVLHACLSRARSGQALDDGTPAPYNEEGEGPTMLVGERDPVPSIGLLPDGPDNEVLGYRVYRGNTQIGVTVSTEYEDTLPAFGTYRYAVTAHHAGQGESEPSNTAEVVWDGVALTLTSADTLVPAMGGSIEYDVHLLSSLAVTVPNVSYWLSVITPGESAVGPFQVTTFTMLPFMDVTVPGLTLNVPAFAPSGDYLLVAHLGFYPNTAAFDTHAFVKQDGYGGDSSVGIASIDPGWNAAPGQLRLPDGERRLEPRSADTPPVPDQSAIAAIAPNPFNDVATVTVHVAQAGHLRVEVVDVLGRRVRSLHDGPASAGSLRMPFAADGLASGVYLIRGEFEGQNLPARKALLIH